MDSVGSWRVDKAERVAPVRAAAPAAVPAAVHQPDPGTTAPSLVKQLAAAPPVDFEHIARIKRAIADGTFPLLPVTVADRLMAFKLNWRSNDKA